MSIVFVVLMLLLISAAVTTALRLSESGLRDTVTHDAQSAAVFLAESGIERAHALQSQAFANGTFATSCQSLPGTGAGPHSLGRGSFSYTASSYTATTCPDSSAAGLVGECCIFTVAAEVAGTRRVVQAQIETTDPNGVAGRDSITKFLNLKTTVANTAIVANLAYRAKDEAGSNAEVDGCANLSSGVFSNCAEQWDLESPGTYSVNGMGVFASIPTAPSTYKLQTNFTTTKGAAIRHYVLTGGLFPPVSATEAVTRRAAFKRDATGALTERTVGQSSVSINIPNTWCLDTGLKEAGFNNFRPDGDVAQFAKADTLVVGFSSMTGVVANATPPDGSNFMNELTLGSSGLPQASFSRLLRMRGLRNTSIVSGTDYYLYSQMWTLHNPAYTMEAGVTASISGAAVTLSGSPLASIAKGTVLSVPDARAVFAPVEVTGVKVTSSALRVPSGTAVANMPAEGDAVYGPYVLSGTFISGPGVLQADSSTLFPVTPAQKANDTGQRILLRAAVKTVNSSTSYTLSRPLATPLLNVKLCGGLCALFQTRNTTVNTPDADINLNGVPAGDEWSLGMTCLSGVRAEGIEIISGPPLRRIAWNEMVQ